MNRDVYPHVYQFLGGYFHQDWALEAKTWVEVVELFARGADREAISGVYDELTALQSQYSDDRRLSEALFELGSCYSPEGDGMRSSEWIQAVQKKLIESLK